MVDRRNGTNGKLNIEEVMKKDPLIEKMLDEDEIVEYISYKKGNILKSLVIIMLLLSVFMVIIFPWGRTFYGKILFIFSILSILLFSQVLILGVLKGKLIVTNKGIIIRSFTKSRIKDSLFATEKIYYSKIEKLEKVASEYYSGLRFIVQGKHYNYKSYPIFSDIETDEIQILAELIEKNRAYKSEAKEVISGIKKNENIRIINEILDENKCINESKSRTNGELSIENLISKKTKILDLLDGDERVKYIAYKKNIAIYLMIIILSIIAFIYVVGVTVFNTWNFEFISGFIFILLLSSFISKEYLNMFLLTDRAFILIKIDNTYDKIYYKDLLKIDFQSTNSGVVVKIFDSKKIIMLYERVYYKFDSYLLLKRINECIDLKDHEIKLNSKRLVGYMVILIIPLSIILIYLKILPDESLFIITCWTFNVLLILILLK